MKTKLLAVLSLLVLWVAVPAYADSFGPIIYKASGSSVTSGTGPGFKYTDTYNWPSEAATFDYAASQSGAALVASSRCHGTVYAQWLWYNEGGFISRSQPPPVDIVIHSHVYAQAEADDPTTPYWFIHDIDPDNPTRSGQNGHYPHDVTRTLYQVQAHAVTGPDGQTMYVLTTPTYELEASGEYDLNAGPPPPEGAGGSTAARVEFDAYIVDPPG